MQRYKVFKHPSGISEAVKQGWSWPAFLFNFIWAMVKKMWGIGWIVLISGLAFGFILVAITDGEGNDTLINVVAIIVNIIFGANGNSWREKNLISRGFVEADTVIADNPENAMALYLKQADAEC